jgi:hypothetical protein
MQVNGVCHYERSEESGAACAGRGRVNWLTAAGLSLFPSPAKNSSKNDEESPQITRMRANEPRRHLRRFCVICGVREGMRVAPDSLGRSE